MKMLTIARTFSIEQFKLYVENLHFNGWTPKFVVVHNTGSPTKKLYREWETGPKKVSREQWLKNLTSYYTNKGWRGCPHLFVGYDVISVLNPLTLPGTHTPSWNGFTWGVETVGDFNVEDYDPDTRRNLVAALGILHSRIGLNPQDFKLGVRGLHFHKEDKNTTHKDCPGKKLVKSQLVKDVLNYMGDTDVGSHEHISEKAQAADTSILTWDELTSISWVQVKLNAVIGAGLKVDGLLGPKTKEAVRKFQAIAVDDDGDKLAVDGIAGPVTRKALKLSNIERIRQ
jgi:peptidoglycan hydrolase-like protein with peptidoglycan-binding domain